MSMNYVLKLKTCPENPAYSCVFEPPNSKLFEKSTLTPPFGLQILPLFEDSKIDLDVVDDTTVTETPPWSRLRDHSSVYTAELQAILFVLKQAYQSKEKKFTIFADSVSAMQVLKNLKTDHPLLIQIQELLHKINADKKETFYVGSWT